MRRHEEWKVETHILSARGPTSSETRRRISSAALLVNVMARIPQGGASPVASRWPMRRVSTRVLPEPAPATTSRGLPRCTTAARCGRVSPSSSAAAVDPLDLVDEARGDALHQVVGQSGPVGRHGIVAGDGADDNGIGIGAPVAHHAHGADGRQHGEALPQLAVQAGPADLLDDDGIGVAQNLGPLPRDLPDDAHAQPGTGERLAPHDLVRQAELLAHRPRQVVGQATDVVVRLDVRCRVAARLDDVGVEGALHQEAGTLVTGALVTRHLLEDADEQLPDDLALALGIGHPLERREVAVGGLHVDQVHVELALEGVLDLVGLAGAHQPGVDEDTGELLADGLVDQRRRHGRVHTAAQRAQDPRRAHLSLHRGHLLLDDRDMGPARETPAGVEEEALEHLAAPLGVDHLGMELHPEDAALGVVEGGDRGVGTGRRGHETRRHLGDGVAVAHPHLGLRRPVDAQR